MCINLHCGAWVSRRFPDKPARGQSDLGLVNSSTDSEFKRNNTYSEQRLSDPQFSVKHFNEYQSANCLVRVRELTTLPRTDWDRELVCLRIVR